MRFRARLVLGLYGLALAVPAAVMAGPLGDDETAPGAMNIAQAEAPPHHHKGIFGRRHCVECQRAAAKARDGVDVPAPPPLEPAVQGQVVISNGAHCPTCQGNMVVSGPVVSNDPHAPGYAVVGGPAGGEEAAGYAVVGEAMVGSEPAPVGISKMRTPGTTDPRMAAMGGRPGAGPLDPSVVPTNYPPQSAVASPPSSRPHIISHLFGIPILGTLRREREQKERDKHAAIAYGQNDKPITQLPASVVYGNGSH
jgi:hypothetical protein